MAVSVPVVAIVTSLHLMAFIFAVGAERRRSTVPHLSISFSLSLVSTIEVRIAIFIVSQFVPVKAKIVPDEYDEQTYCVYGTDASAVYGLAAFGLLLLSHTVLNGVTRCLCCGKGLITGSSTTWTVFFFVFSW